MKTRNNNVFSAGITFLELVVVLVIISVMVGIVLPFCQRSNNSLKIKQATNSIAQTLRYAIDLAQKQNRTVMFIFNEKYGSYYLKIDKGDNSFKPVDDFTGTEKFIDENIHLYDYIGFEQAGSNYSLTFNPQNTWANALISFFAKDMIITIRIKSKIVDIEEKEI